MEKMLNKTMEVIGIILFVAAIAAIIAAFVRKQGYLFFVAIVSWELGKAVVASSKVEPKAEEESK